MNNFGIELMTNFCWPVKKREIESLSGDSRTFLLARTGNTTPLSDVAGIVKSG